MKKRLSVLSMLTAGMLMLTVSPAMVYARSTTDKASWGTLAVAGYANEPALLLKHQGQTYLDLWYLTRLLSQHGWSTRWDGHQLTLVALPVPSPAVQVSLRQQLLPGNTAETFGGATYVDLNAIAQSLQGSVTFNATEKSLTLLLSPHSMQTGRTRTTRVKNGQNTKTPLRAVSSKRIEPLGIALVALGTKPLGGMALQTVAGQAYCSVAGLQSVFSHLGIQLLNQGNVIHIAGLPTLFSGISLQSPQLGAMTNKSAAVTLIQVGLDWYVPTQALPALGLTENMSGTKLLIGTVTDGEGGSTGSTGSTSATSGLGAVTKTIQISGQLVDATGARVAGKIVLQDPNGNLFTMSAASTGAFSGAFSAVYPTATAAATEAVTLVASQTPATGWVGQYATLTGHAGSIDNVVVNAAADQLFATVTGHIDSGATGAAVMPVVEVSLRNKITQAHYYEPVDNQGNFSGSVPVGSYEVFALVTAKSALYCLQPFTVTPSGASVSVTLPPAPINGTLTTAHAIIVAGDSGVLPENILSIANIFEHVYPLDVSTLSWSERKPITVTLYSTLKQYANHFQSEGFSSAEASKIAEDSGGVTEGANSISISLPAFGEVDGLNILAHELDHALVSTVSVQLPSWVNEGLAWHEGILAQLDGSPSSLLLDGAEWNEWSDIVQGQQNQALVPLGSGDPLSATYNVEDQDYFAVNQLIDKYGVQNVLNYVYHFDTNASEFQTAFGTSFLTFSQQVTDALTAATLHTDKGFTITIKVLAGGPTDLYVENNKGARSYMSGLQPGQIVTITCGSNGAITVPASLTVTKASSLSQVVEGDWYIGSGVAANGSLETSSGSPPAAATGSSTGIVMGGGIRQEFEVSNEFGHPVLVRAVMYDSSNQVLHAYPAIALPNGLELVSILPIA